MLSLSLPLFFGFVSCDNTVFCREEKLNVLNEAQNWKYCHIQFNQAYLFKVLEMFCV